MKFLGVMTNTSKIPSAERKEMVQIGEIEYKEYADAKMCRNLRKAGINQGAHANNEQNPWKQREGRLKKQESEKIR